MASPDNISINFDDLLGIIERQARQVQAYVANPPPDFSPEQLSRHVARMFAFTDQLCAMAAEVRKQQASRNGEEKAA